MIRENGMNNFFYCSTNAYIVLQFQRYMLGFFIIFLPITLFPIQFPIVGNSIPLIFLMLGYFGYLIEIIIYPKSITKYEKYGSLFLGILLGWNILSGIVDINYYQYFQFLDINQDDKLRILYTNLNFGFTVNDLIVTKIWISFLSIRGAIFNCLFGYGIVLWIIHMYKDDFDEAFKDINRAIHVLCVIISIYSIFEVGYLLGIYFCKDILTYINPLFMKVAYLNDWWPPLLWTNLQVRSLFAEPSFFGMFLAMALPFLSSDFFEGDITKRKKVLASILYIFMIMLLVMSKARTALVLFLCEMITLFGWQLIFNKKDWNKFSQLIGCTFLAICLGLFCIFHFQSIDNKVVQLNNTSVQSYVSQNVTSVVGNQRSNSARKANVIAMINVGLQNPIFGVGQELVHEYIADKLTIEDLNNPEVRKWTDDLKGKGPLRAGYPILNQLAWSFATQGIIGLMLFVFPILYILYKCFLYRKYLSDFKEVFSLIAFEGLVIAFFSNSAQLEYFVLCGLLFCLLRKKYTEERDC